MYRCILCAGVQGVTLYCVPPAYCVQGYKVYYTQTPDMPINLWTVHPVDSSQLTTLTNLVTNKTYTICVLGYTSVGDGPLSEPIAVITQQGGK